MRIRTVLTLGILAVLPAARADQALVVGIQEYSPLVAASTLKGCMNDANGVAEVLKEQGFVVTLLLNEKATKQGILGSIAQIAEKTKKDERFVFYFAGHGRRSPRFALMPSDATISGNDIEPKELNAAILKVQARSRTVLLDSCFSGGMAAGEMSRGLDDFKARYFDPEQARSVTFGPVKTSASNKDTPEKLETAPGICYYAASLDSEQALEATMDDGKRHGLFTYGLIKNLRNGKLWSEVHNDIKKQMTKRLENSGRQQNPMISTAYMPTPAMDNILKGAPKPPPGKTLLDIWNADNPNPGKIGLKIKPDRDVQDVGKEIGLEVKVGQDGYLVILGQVGDRIYQFFPASEKAEDAKVSKGTINFPTGRDRLFFDSFGADHLKAMLFSTAEEAAGVMDALMESQGKARDLVLARAVSEPAFTSRLSIAVGDSLVGGLRLKDLDGLLVKVMKQEDEISKFLASKLRLACTGYPKGDNWVVSFDPTQKPELSDRETFMTLLNLAMQAGLLYDEPAFKGVKLSKDVMGKVKKPPSGDALIALNRSILAQLFPNEVNADDAEKK